MTITPSIEERLRAMVGEEHVRAAVADDLILGVHCSTVVSPGTEKEVAELLAFANERGLAVIPCGGGTKLGWGNPPTRADILLSMKRLGRVIEHAWADLTVAVEAGCTMQELQDTLVRQGQRLALDCLWPEKATIGGVLSTNDSGVLRLRYGALRDLIIGVTIALPDGTLASSGGKVVKNVAGYDLPKLITGALGTLGVVTRAVFRTHPVCRESAILSFGAPGAEAMQAKILAIQNSQLAHTALQIRASSDGTLEADALFEGRAAGLAARRKQLQALLGNAGAIEGDASVWRTNERLWDAAESNCVVAKLIVLPAMLSTAVRKLEQLGAASGSAWKAVLQATGIGWIRLDGAAHPLRDGIAAMRTYAEANGGSVTILHRPAGVDTLDCWGTAGDSILLMRTLKQQFDPKGTLNPGRFLGGI
jgi:glycolate oxidase FAD binding subunit